MTLSNNKTFLLRASIIPLYLIKKKTRSKTRHKEGLNIRDDLAYAKEWRNFFNRAVIARLRRRAISAKVPWKLASLIVTRREKTPQFNVTVAFFRKTDNFPPPLSRSTTLWDAAQRGWNKEVRRGRG